MSLRRWLALKKRGQVGGVWPIKPGSERPPAGWPGWPKGKRFALVLTHDVEGTSGLARCRPLMDLETELGFRSSFNFIPEGAYTTPSQLRDQLSASGFEVGVHDLSHDGRLYRSRAAFRGSAQRINRYFKEWNAVGFRSGFMLRELGWLHDLEMLYDASTFDTDPFEPQPDGVNTIFPFWVPSPLPLRSGERAGVRCAPVVPDLGTQNSKPETRNPIQPGYVELPYTLPQDSTLFLVLREKTIAVWKKKLDWIAEHGGMALLNVHPDYIAFDDRAAASPRQFPVALYREFLEYVNQRYHGDFWNALPRDVARHVISHREKLPAPSPLQASLNSRSTPPTRIWIDLDNTPHVPFFIPIMRELERRGHRIFLTARDAFQVCELADRKGMQYLKVGRHYGKNRLLKVAGLVWRSLQLLPSFLRQRPALALSHGARSQMFLANLLRVPTVLILDYEFAKTPPLVRPRWEIVPDSLPQQGLHSRNQRVRRYRGIKEDVYAPEFRPDPSLLEDLGLKESDLIVTVRPPANEAHYHNPESELLLTALMQRICQTPGVRVVMLPRNRSQEDALRAAYPQWFAEGRTLVPTRAVDGLNLLWYSDLVVSGGGTMNREAAALGVPVYSIFRGKTGAVDRKLEEEGRLIMICSVAEVESRIAFTRRDKSVLPDQQPRAALKDIVDHIEDIIRQES